MGFQRPGWPLPGLMGEGFPEEVPSTSPLPWEGKAVQGCRGVWGGQGGGEAGTMEPLLVVGAGPGDWQSPLALGALWPEDLGHPCWKDAEKSVSSHQSCPVTWRLVQFTSLTRSPLLPGSLWLINRLLRQS